jgi:hypothetical protein
MMTFKTVSRIAPAIALCLAAAAAQSAEPAAPAATDLYSALTGGKARLDFRYRLETVDQDPFDKDATASTLRSRLSTT